MKNFMKQPRRLFLATLIFSYLLLLFFFPSLCIEGARNGLLLWFEQLLPSLLPFLILSGLCVRFGLSEMIGKLFYPLLRFLPISSHGSYPIIIGLLSGYPVGAKTCADMLIEKKLSKKEASFLLCCCNNASPMFLTGFAACSCLGIPEKRYLIFFIIVISGFLSALILYPFFFKNMKEISSYPISHSSKQQPKQQPVTVRSITAMQKLDETILGSFEVMVKVGGYIILFSIPATLLLSLFSYLFVNPSETVLLFTTAILGLLEISTGTSIIGSSYLSLTIKTVLTLSICAFGGLSALAQTKSVIGSSGLSISYYIISKLLQAVLAGLLGYFLLCF